MKTDRHTDLWIERACHLVAVGLSVTAAFVLRFDFSIPADFESTLKQAVLIAIVVEIADLRQGWIPIAVCVHFVSIPDLYIVFLGNVAGSSLFAAVMTFWLAPAMPRSIFSDRRALLVFCRYGAGALFGSNSQRSIPPATFRGGASRHHHIHGAGAAGAELVHEIHSNRCTAYEAKGFLDDDPLKQGALIMGVPVLGSGRQASSVIRRLNRCKPVVEEIIIAMPSASGQQMREASANCRAARIPCKTVPGIEELLSGKVLTSQVRNLSVHDLLGRQPVKLDEARVQASLGGRSVLITGAAGSIGSELCRQVARLQSRDVWLLSIRLKAISLGLRTNSGKGIRNWSW